MSKENIHLDGQKDVPDNAPTIDAFGQPSVEAVVIKQEVVAEAKKYEAIPEDHPILISLNDRVKNAESSKDELGKNLSGQRGKIDKLEKEIETLKGVNNSGGKEDRSGLPYPEIKYSKDLSKEEKEEMTDAEIKQLDTLANLQETVNTLFKNSSAKSEETVAVSDTSTSIKDEAKKLATRDDGTIDIDLANQIIENSKQFNFEGLDSKALSERVNSAYRLLPTYTPPKEQGNKKGKVATNTTASEDPFGNDSIIEQATTEQAGNYQL